MKEREYSVTNSFVGYTNYIKQELGVDSLTEKEYYSLMQMYIGGIHVDKALEEMKK